MMARGKKDTRYGGPPPPIPPPISAGSQKQPKTGGKFKDSRYGKGNRAATKRAAKKIKDFNALELAGFTTGAAADVVGRSDTSWVDVFDPNGLGYFDPVGFTVGASEKRIRAFREAELKHGRIAMLAWVGLVVPAYVRIPGEAYSFEKVPRVLDAHDAVNGLSDASGAGFQILIFITIVEFCCAKKVFEWNSLETAGDYGLRNLLPKDPEGEKRMRLAELKNGRLAMIAFGGAVTQMAITGNDFPWLY